MPRAGSSGNQGSLRGQTRTVSYRTKPAPPYSGAVLIYDGRTYEHIEGKVKFKMNYIPY